MTLASRIDNISASRYLLPGILVLVNNLEVLLWTALEIGVSGFSRVANDMRLLVRCLDLAGCLHLAQTVSDEVLEKLSLIRRLTLISFGLTMMILRLTVVTHPHDGIDGECRGCQHLFYPGDGVYGDVWSLGSAR